MTTADHSALAGQLERLSALWNAGVLTEAEFSLAKARLLGITPAEPTNGISVTEPNPVPPHVVAETTSAGGTQTTAPVIPPSSRACGRAGCSLQGVWTDDEVCQACGFPTRAGKEAEYAAHKRQLLRAPNQGLDGEQPATSPSLVTPERGVSRLMSKKKQVHAPAYNPVPDLRSDSAPPDDSEVGRTKRKTTRKDILLGLAVAASGPSSAQVVLARQRARDRAAGKKVVPSRVDENGVHNGHPTEPLPPEAGIWGNLWDDRR